MNTGMQRNVVNVTDSEANVTAIVAMTSGPEHPRSNSLRRVGVLSAVGGPRISGPQLGHCRSVSLQPYMT